MIIRIGKAQDNDCVVDDPYISRYHARLGRNEDGSLYIEDTDSANGTYVNDDRVIRKTITLSDRIVLGRHFRLDVDEILKTKNDYSEEFERLKTVYDNYVQSKIRIQSSGQFKTRLFQMIPFAISGVAGLIMGFVGKGNPQIFIASLFLAVCAPTLGIYLGAKQSAKIPGRLQHLANQFKIDYVCPKCGTFLGEIPWESLVNKKQCPVNSCKAKWSKA